MVSNEEFAAFWKAHRGLVGVVCRQHKVPPEDVDDIAQEVALGIWKKWDKIQSRATTPGYWTACVKTEAYQRILKSRGFNNNRDAYQPKAAGQRNTFPAGLGRDPENDDVRSILDVDPTLSAEDQYLQWEAVDHIWSCINRLEPERYREVLLLRFIQGMSYDEMGAKLGLRFPQLNMRINKARRKLRKMIDDA